MREGAAVGEPGRVAGTGQVVVEGGGAGADCGDGVVGARVAQNQLTLHSGTQTCCAIVGARRLSAGLFKYDL
jgi:hypothetical protein